MKIEGVEGIVWDLDGTLLDSFGIFGQILQDVVAESGHQMPTEEELLKNYHGSLEDTIQNVLGLSSAEELAAVVDKFLLVQEDHYKGDINTHLFNDATKLAQQAARKGILQLVVTNRAHEGRGSASPRTIIASTVLADCIHEVRAGDDMDYRKPDKRTVEDWSDSHNFSREALLVIGDQHVDAQLALNLGARALLVGRNGTIPHIDGLDVENRGRIIVVDNLDAIEL